MLVACRFNFASLVTVSLLLLSRIFTVSTESVKTTNEGGTSGNANAVGRRPIQLTSRDFSKYTGDGNVWLIEFYTPWCTHCQEFSKPYANIASAFHSSPEEKIRVGKVDCSEEKSLMNRFHVTGFPTLFVVDGYSVYEFNGKRSEANLMNFVRGGYKKEEAIPFIVSPMGPMGQLQQLLVHLGHMFVDTFRWVQSLSGMSPIMTGMIVCTFGVFWGMAGIILLTILTKPKLD
ncbi:unnamed protein product [Cylindrotheca closterium]|uniref:Thioredoxin domain-containing protein n=1 Tax=Cylindrotheca closterium TaxID=2856 RepID=A0AAD2CF46_9STRA|nr:unnamed protein product [Cylindrotheca closterium]